MSGIGVAIAFVIPASAATNGFGTGATPEEATNNAGNVCRGEGLDPGSILNQTQVANGSWQVTVACVERTNPVPSGFNAEGTGTTPQEADIAARTVCAAEGLVAGNQIGMVDLGGGTLWKATVECLAP
jgi:hypothetical protein